MLLLQENLDGSPAVRVASGSANLSIISTHLPELGQREDLISCSILKEQPVIPGAIVVTAERNSSKTYRSLAKNCHGLSRNSLLLYMLDAKLEITPNGRTTYTARASDAAKINHELLKGCYFER